MILDAVALRCAVLICVALICAALICAVLSCGVLTCIGRVDVSEDGLFEPEARTFPPLSEDLHNVILLLEADSRTVRILAEQVLEVLLRSDEETLGAGDQGIMFGYACDETEELMPLPISLAHKLAKRLEYARENNILDFLRPDGKTQVTVEYDGDKPVRIDTVVVSTQHTDTISIEKLRDAVKKEIILPVIPAELLDEKTKYYINPTGRFVIGGPESDSGLTGRKIIVDTYGGYARHGGGAFSGKDPTKVDRSAAYAARYIAKNVVAAKLARKCEIQLSYAIGVSAPVSIYINTFGTNTVEEDRILNAIEKVFNLTPEGIIKSLNLKELPFADLSHYGHIGREDLNVSFEKTDKVEELLNNI